MGNSRRTGEENMGYSRNTGEAKVGNSRMSGASNSKSQMDGNYDKRNNTRSLSANFNGTNSENNTAVILNEKNHFASVTSINM